MLFFCCFSL